MGQKMASANGVKCYSDSLSPELQAQVRAICARQGGKFSTRIFTGAENSEPAWLSAEMDGGPNRWSVYQFRTTAIPYADEDGKLSNGDLPNARRRLASDICFFDALHACAAFETEELYSGATAAGARGAEHYRAFADAEGIVFDKRDNLPLPVADGKVLPDDCVLAPDADETVRKSKGNLLRAVDIIGEQSARGTRELVQKNAAAVSQNALALSQRKTTIDRIEKSYDGKNTKIRKVYDTFRDVVQSAEALNKVEKSGLISVASIPVLTAVFLATPFSFMTAPFFLAGIASSVLFGMRYGTALDMGDARGSVTIAKEFFAASGLRFKIDLASLRKAGASFSEPAMRDAFNYTANQAEIAFRLTKARQAYERTSEGGNFFARAKLNRTLRKLEKTARKYGTGDGEIENLMAAVEDEQIVQTLSSRLYEKINALSEMVRQAQSRALKALPVPAI
jgi:hypothetical protein